MKEVCELASFIMILAVCISELGAWVALACLLWSAMATGFKYLCDKEDED